MSTTKHFDPKTCSEAKEANHSGEKSFACDLSQKDLETADTLCHESVLNNEAKQFVCEICDTVIEDCITLKKHYIAHIVEKEYDEKKKCKDKVKKQFVCDICDKKFLHRISLKWHSITHAHEKGLSENEVFKWMPPPKKFERRPVSCDICKKVIGRPQDLKRHYRVHTGEKPFVCGICNKGFSLKSGLTKHEQRHRGEISFLCEMCGYFYKDAVTFRTHQRHHTGERPYVCKLCNRSFIGRSNLKKHLLTHSSERPFICEVCGKTYKDSFHLKVHKRIHTGEKYECTFCDQKLTQRSSLVRHIRRHHKSKETES